MTSTEQNTERFLATLQSFGGSAGNGKLREELGWQESTYLRIKHLLIEQGDIVSGRGRGGSVALAETAVVQNRARNSGVKQAGKVVEVLKVKATKTHAEADTVPSVRRSGVVKKSDLYSSIWASCDELRGGMDAGQYKDYVLFMLFIKYISDKYGNSKDFAPPVVIPPGASFKDMVALKGKADIGDRINTQVIQKLIDANTKLARSDFPDFNDPNKLGEGPAMVERLGNLIAIFEKPELNFANNRADNDDLLGDAYEYLMRHFAQDSGKSKGQFYTPSEVSSIIAQVIGISHANSRGSTTAYDPTCGSGSLLLKVAAEASRQITLEGQEKDVTTAGLARMNMILHHFPSATILGGDTLSNPRFKDGEQLRSYDYVVANPPFSDKKWSTGLTPSNDLYQRFAWGAPPAKQGDYAYLLHVIRSMKATTGKGAIILPHGVLFRGNAEGVIRKNLVRSGVLKGIIGLPANLFYGTGIPACILVLDKENAGARKGIFMIDASKGFIKDGPKNRLREQDIHRIVDTFRRGVDVPRYARMVSLGEVSSDRNSYNLNLPRYIDSSEPEDLQDIDAHLNGGIPERDIDAFAADWQEMPALREALFEAERPGYARLRQPVADVRSIIQSHPQFQQFRSKVETLFGKWRQAVTPLLTGIQPGDKPKALISQISETLLATFHAAPLLDPYDIYQHLMDYWAEVMQDDAYLIAADGWVAQPRRIVEIDKKGKAKDKGWICDLLPKSYIVACYLATEQAELEAKQAELESLSSQFAELQEEHGGEEGLLFEAQDEKGVLTKASVGQRFDAAQEGGVDVAELGEIQLLRKWLELKENEVALKRAVKTLEAKIDQQAQDQYAALSEAEVKALVVEDKWLAHLQADVQKEMTRISQTLAQRIRELAERYEVPMPKLEDDLAILSAKIEMHLKRMGAAWK
ncbi:type I restriction-modification system subunit M [Xanthomonas arboricola]|uniref:type I restriction-modification system subunit M n=2 Tax=Xanthomonas arboricola TaxID=56448 RepID=UPI000CEDB9A6|nr:class I SAM-dependent DNA methyltransferase [Xanthomonas arboricola]PPU24570.1 type I restriction endonuclease subunit M [Xanthomonas arboricola pv. guizotiae]